MKPLPCLARAALLAASTLALGACGGVATRDASLDVAPDASSAPDTAVLDAALDALDAPSAPDALATLDALALADAPSAPDAPPARDDAAPDAPPASDATAPDPACMHFAADEVIARCGDRYLMIARMLPGPGAPSSCMPYFAAGDGRYATQDEALRGAGCDTRCLYRFATSVTRLYCGRRTGYETLAAEGCPGLVRFAEGYFSSVEEHDAMYPCRDE